MTSKFTSIIDASSLRSISIEFTPRLFHAGEGVAGDIGITFEITLDVENLEKFTSSGVGFALTRLYMNLITSEPTGCGAEERLLQEKMKRDTQHSLMRSLEDLLESLEKLSQELGYEQK